MRKLIQGLKKCLKYKKNEKKKSDKEIEIIFERLLNKEFPRDKIDRVE